MATAKFRGSTADRILIRSIRGWGREPDDRYWERFAPRWRDRLLACRRIEQDSSPPASAVLELLRLEHAAEARPDLLKVHPSWLVRALQAESPAVQRAVAKNSPDWIRSLLIAKLGLDENDLETDLAAEPKLIENALALWCERLLGGPLVRDEDPPAIVALTRFRPVDRVRLLIGLGIVKRAYAATSNESSSRQTPTAAGTSRSRRLDLLEDEYRKRWAALGERDPRLVELANRDLLTARDRGARHDDVRAGLATLARLLSTADAQRVRWALQQIPYDSAKAVRGLMSLDFPSISRAELAGWEQRMLGMAGQALFQTRSPALPPPTNPGGAP